MGICEFTVNRIYELCRERKITPNALSYLCGIPQATVKSILNGESKNPGIVNIKKLWPAGESRGTKWNGECLQ